VQTDRYKVSIGRKRGSRVFQLVSVKRIAPARARANVQARLSALDGHYLGSFRSFLALCGFELDLLSILEPPEPLHLDVGMMYE